MDSKGHEVRAYKSCIAILSFSNTYGKEEIESLKSCTWSKYFKSKFNWSNAKNKKLSLLLHSRKSVNNSYLNDHENIRGGLYYAKSDI